MKPILHQMTLWTRRRIWAILVAYMLAMHNFYNGEDKVPDDMGITFEIRVLKEDGADA